ncbi:MAG: TIGR00366 family protein, partial [Acidobacteria bacterium]|nr:TIGR00366 family protein [Acidobacteriota bacterium]
ASWGDSFWDLLRFTNQITLTLLLGYAFANTPPVQRVLLRIAGLAKTPASAYLLACLTTGICALFSWGLSLITAGIMARAIGQSCRRKGIEVHYPLLVASAFSGFVIWHQGLSSSIGLALATPGHILEEELGIIPTSLTLFTPWNLGVALLILLTLPFLMAQLRPRGDEQIEQIPDELYQETDEEDGPEKTERTPAQRFEDSRLPTLAIVAAGGVFLWVHFITRGNGLELNTLNFGFLLLGILLAGSALRYVQIIVSGGRIAAPFLLQYPFYAGIAGMMRDSGLAQMLVDAFVSISSPQTLPLFGFLSGGLLNLFIPSGGGQWAVQGPIMMAAAQEIGADLPRVAMSVALGDQWTNLIQPLAIIPVITIAGITVRRIMGYTFVALIWSGLVFAVALALF